MLENEKEASSLRQVLFFFRENYKSYYEEIELLELTWRFKVTEAIGPMGYDRRGKYRTLYFLFRENYKIYYEKNTKRIAGTTDMWV